MFSLFPLRRLWLVLAVLFALTLFLLSPVLFRQPAPALAVVTLLRRPNGLPTLHCSLADYDALSRSYAAWRVAATDSWSALGFPTHSSLARVFSIFDLGASVAKSDARREIFNFAPPRASASTCPLVYYGPSGDGGKWLCSVENMRKGCIIYSLGSRNEFDFEESMLATTPCTIHTFDCTVDGSAKPNNPRVVFHRQCLGDRDDARHYLPLAALAAENGHAHIDILKMDIEGGEYSVFRALAAARGDPATASLLPDQISFESHVNVDDNFWRMWSDVLDLGYAIVSREDNIYCSHCVEYTVVRAFLPAPPDSPPPPAAATAAHAATGTAAALSIALQRRRFPLR